MNGCRMYYVEINLSEVACVAGGFVIRTKNWEGGEKGLKVFIVEPGTPPTPKQFLTQKKNFNLSPVFSLSQDHQLRSLVGGSRSSEQASNCNSRQLFRALWDFSLRCSKQ